FYFFFFNPSPPTSLYTLSLHDALPILSSFFFCVTALVTYFTAPSCCGDGMLSDRSSTKKTFTPSSGRFHCKPAIPRISASKTIRSEEHTSELQSPYDLVCRLLLEKKKQ